MRDTKRKEKYAARVTLLESFDLGKNTGQRAGIAIGIFSNYGLVGRIQIGQGSFKWWPAWAKGPATLSLNWSEFSDFMKKIEEDRK